MKKSILTLALAVAFGATASAQTPAKPAEKPAAKSDEMTPGMTQIFSPVPPVVDPGPFDAVLPVPSDAIVLLGKNGKMDEWKRAKDGAPCPWKYENGVMTVVPGTGAILSRRSFGDCQLHVEWRSPVPPTGNSQGRGNSGIFMQNLYEIQVLDSYNNPTYVNGQAGAIYKQSIPLVNPCREPGKWNVYDIIFTAPRFNDKGQVLYPARATVLFNGVLVQNDFHILGPTLNIGVPRYGEPYTGGPIQLQDHNHPVSYRNIWIREL